MMTVTTIGTSMHQHMLFMCLICAIDTHTLLPASLSGYGDIYPKTGFGRGFLVMVGLFGIAGLAGYMLAYSQCHCVCAYFAALGW